ncbi:DUF2225 domain-containing protein [Clostridium peptidivorans]|uniref:DUF2225 domain-containing protein n=1 Tax=Clostridium peptidivorans TaxID=100174 RepID=UPI0015C7BF10|nr:DUF2225 domain-containing protein [Clostridium peptidivorans]
MSNKIFSDLHNLGFDNLNNMNIYKKDDNNSIVEDKKKEVNKLSHIYEKEVTCPVCNNVLKVKAVKSSSYRFASKDSDLFMRFGIINPYFYDVWICDNCGYASLKNDSSFDVNNYESQGKNISFFQNFLKKAKGIR